MELLDAPRREGQVGARAAVESVDVPVRHALDVVGGIEGVDPGPGLGDAPLRRLEERGLRLGHAPDALTFRRWYPDPGPQDRLWRVGACDRARASYTTDLCSVAPGRPQDRLALAS